MKTHTQRLKELTDDTVSRIEEQLDVMFKKSKTHVYVSIDDRVVEDVLCELRCAGYTAREVDIETGDKNEFGGACHVGPDDVGRTFYQVSVCPSHYK